MSLKEIKDYLAKRSPEKLIHLLEDKEIIINKKIEKLQKMATKKSNQYNFLKEKVCI